MARAGIRFGLLYVRRRRLRQEIVVIMLFCYMSLIYARTPHALALECVVYVMIMVQHIKGYTIYKRRKLSLLYMRQDARFLKADTLLQKTHFRQRLGGSCVN